MKKKKIKLCLTKQLLNMFKLWCEWGINHKQRQNVAKSYKIVTEFFNIWHDFGY